MTPATPASALRAAALAHDAEATRLRRLRRAEEAALLAYQAGAFARIAALREQEQAELTAAVDARRLLQEIRASEGRRVA